MHFSCINTHFQTKVQRVLKELLFSNLVLKSKSIKNDEAGGPAPIDTTHHDSIRPVTNMSGTAGGRVVLKDHNFSVLLSGT